ncbi:hypothetical protein BH09BAC3_BH09BAC3_25470 [soil metagenome]
MKAIIQLLSMITVSATFAFSQTSSILDHSVQWTSAENINLYTNTPVSENFTITSSANSITIAAAGTVKTFSINNVQGTWTKLESIGLLACNVSIGDKNGVIILERTSGQISIRVDFSSYPNAMKRKFVISHYKQQD